MIKYFPGEELFGRKGLFKMDNQSNKGVNMKITTLTILTLITLIFAEKQLIVHTSDGEAVAYPITKIDSLTIKEYTPKIGPFSSTWWTVYSVSSTGDNYSEEFSGSTYPARVSQYYGSDKSYGLQIKGTSGLGLFRSLKITYKASHEVTFGALTGDYDFISGARLPASPNSPRVAYVEYGDFSSSSIDMSSCRIFEFKMSDSEITGSVEILDMEADK